MGNINKSSPGNFIWCYNSSKCKNIRFSESDGLLITQKCNKNDVDQYWKVKSALITKKNCLNI